MKYTLGPAAEITTGGTKQYTIEDGDKRLELFVVEHNGQYVAYENRCPHLGVTLNWRPDIFLNLEETHIQCTTHNAQFRIDNGLCEWGPCIGESLRKLDLTLQSGNLLLTLG